MSSDTNDPDKRIVVVWINPKTFPFQQSGIRKPIKNMMIHLNHRVNINKSQ